ncbi:GrpB family protein [Alkaliphilus transvaalensis]|uniref:GrpB family protein n=1 Tax=Alkaliphilus transvaalensis TaxID=114628 RepID=UPI0004799A8E|nr:GrpB family protein [Alkaliphilus transvaalensis]
MRQDFSNVSNKKLSELFPVLLEPHNSAWIDYYFVERDFLQSVFGDTILRINHIGSSSVPGLIAKPTIDILVEIPHDIDLSAITEKMKDEGYVVNNPKKDIIMYLKGYTPRGFEGQCVHIHVRHYDDWDELYFRDYLISYPNIAHEYGKLKLKLKEQYPHDRDGYTEAKGVFVKKYSEYARAEFPYRYIPVK